MMLHLVGSGEGIDISNIEKIIKYDSSSELFVAGGINSASNIKKLNKYCFYRNDCGSCFSSATAAGYRKYGGCNDPGNCVCPVIG